MDYGIFSNVIYIYIYIYILNKLFVIGSEL